MTYLPTNRNFIVYEHNNVFYYYPKLIIFFFTGTRQNPYLKSPNVITPQKANTNVKL